MKRRGSRHGWVIVAVGLLAAALLYIFVRPAYQVAGLLGLLSVMFGLVVVVPKLIAPDHPMDALSGINKEASLQQTDERIKLQNDIRTTLLQAATGIALLVGVFFTWKQLNYDRREALLLKDQAREQLDLTRQGQVADRFTRAVDQLGSDQETIRLGGIYGLETIAIQSPETRLLAYEVLTAFVRQRANVPQRNPFEHLHDRTRLEDREPDVHAAMTVLGRRIVLAADPPLNLRNVDLHGADLRKADLSRAVLDHSNLNGANLDQTKLENTHIVEAALRSATFKNAQARRLDAHNSLFQDASFKDAQLGGSNFEDSDLRSTQFIDASLEGANIKCVILDDSNLIRAELGGANFNKSDLRGARLDDANLDGASADQKTDWPAGFDHNAAGVRMVGPQESMKTQCER